MLIWRKNPNNNFGLRLTLIYVSYQIILPLDFIDNIIDVARSTLSPSALFQRKKTGRCYITILENNYV